MSFQAIAPQQSSHSISQSDPLTESSSQIHAADAPVILIRRPSLSDCEHIYALMNNSQVAYWTTELPFASLENVQEQIRQSSNQTMLIAYAGNDVIGTLTLTQYDKARLRHVGRINQVVVHQHWRGHGVGSKLMRSAIELADSWLNLKRLELLVYTDNDPAIHLYSKFGFISEGTLRHIVFRAGQYADCLIMARIAH